MSHTLEDEDIENAIDLCYLLYDLEAVHTPFNKDIFIDIFRFVTFNKKHFTLSNNKKHFTLSKQHCERFIESLPLICEKSLCVESIPYRLYAIIFQQNELQNKSPEELSQLKKAIENIVANYAIPEKISTQTLLLALILFSYKEDSAWLDNLSISYNEIEKTVISPVLFNSDSNIDYHDYLSRISFIRYFETISFELNTQFLSKLNDILFANKKYINSFGVSETCTFPNDDTSKKSFLDCYNLENITFLPDDNIPQTIKSKYVLHIANKVEDYFNNEHIIFHNKNADYSHYCEVFQKLFMLVSPDEKFWTQLLPFILYRSYLNWHLFLTNHDRKLLREYILNPDIETIPSNFFKYVEKFFHFGTIGECTSKDAYCYLHLFFSCLVICMYQESIYPISKSYIFDYSASIATFAQSHAANTDSLDCDAITHYLKYLKSTSESHSQLFSEELIDIISINPFQVDFLNYLNTNVFTIDISIELLKELHQRYCPQYTPSDISKNNDISKHSVEQVLIKGTDISTDKKQRLAAILLTISEEYCAI